MTCRAHGDRGDVQRGVECIADDDTERGIGAGVLKAHAVVEHGILPSQMSRRIAGGSHRDIVRIERAAYRRAIVVLIVQWEDVGSGGGKIELRLRAYYIADLG